MKIKNILQQRRTVSCEFFPPREESGIPAVFRAIDRVRAFNPDFISVTYGAGGSTRALPKPSPPRSNATPTWK